MRRLLIRLWSLTVLFTLILAPAAEATNDGRGFYGATNDKAVTNTGFILVLFFPILVLLLSLLQGRLEKRKKARLAARKAHLGNAQWRGGW